MPRSTKFKITCAGGTPGRKHRKTDSARTSSWASHKSIADVHTISNWECFFDLDQCASAPPLSRLNQYREEAYMFAFPRNLLSSVSVSMRRQWRSRTGADRQAEAIWLTEIERLAHETGISADYLRILEMLGIHGANLLRRRMDILRVEPDSLCDSEHAIFRELQKSCSACESHELCALDLAQDAIDPTRPDWQDYCPNAAIVKMLSALENCACREPELDELR